MDRVEVAGDRIRDIVNDPRRRHALMQNRQRWLQLCSAMDAIGDTQLAVRAYLDEPLKDVDSNGWSYVVVYGILQVLYVQQDAAKVLASALRLPFELPDDLVTIRELRNDSIGHAAVRGAFISRMSLSQEGFQLLMPIRKGKQEIRGINLRTVADQQTDIMGSLLERALEQLVADELEHRKKFRAHPLRGLCGGLGYAVEKISAGLTDAGEVPMAMGGVDVVADAVAKFRGAIEERGLTEAYADSVGDTMAEIDFALERLVPRLKGAHADWTPRDVEVYRFFLAAKVNELKSLAKEIDDDYDSDEV
ncbi:MAG: hypothetical protein IT176_09120 [Acidobacteria bacterium]|nr:hypothetical protein [Acidobacteriota bacterium]